MDKTKTTLLTITLLFFQLSGYSMTFLEPIDFGKKVPKDLSHFIENTFIDSTYIFDEKGNLNGKLLVDDLNKDFKMDYVFHGWLGGEGNETFVFLDNGNGYERTHITGHVVKYDSVLMKLTIYSSGCCDAHWDNIEKYEIIGLKCEFKERLLFDKSSLDNENFIHTVDHLFVAGKNEMKIEFETTNEIYHLRYSPGIDNQLLEYPILTRNGNIIASYPKNSFGQAIAQDSDSTGRIWYLVIMENNLTTTYSIFPERYNKDKFIGWISSNYINEK